MGDLFEFAAGWLFGRVRSNSCCQSFSFHVLWEWLFVSSYPLWTVDPRGNLLVIMTRISPKIFVFYFPSVGLLPLFPKQRCLGRIGLEAILLPPNDVDTRWFDRKIAELQYRSNRDRWRLSEPSWMVFASRDFDSRQWISIYENADRIYEYEENVGLNREPKEVIDTTTMNRKRGYMNFDSFVQNIRSTNIRNCFGISIRCWRPWSVKFYQTESEQFKKNTPHHY